MVLKYRNIITNLEHSHKPYLIIKDSWMKTSAELKILSKLETFIVLEVTMQAARSELQPTILLSKCQATCVCWCNSGSTVVGKANYLMVGFMTHSARGNPWLVHKPRDITCGTGNISEGRVENFCSSYTKKLFWCLLTLWVQRYILEGSVILYSFNKIVVTGSPHRTYEHSKHVFLPIFTLPGMCFFLWTWPIFLYI